MTLVRIVPGARAPVLRCVALAVPRAPLDAVLVSDLGGDVCACLLPGLRMFEVGRDGSGVHGAADVSLHIPHAATTAALVARAPARMLCPFEPELGGFGSVVAAVFPPHRLVCVSARGAVREFALSGPAAPAAMHVSDAGVLYLAAGRGLHAFARRADTHEFAPLFGFVGVERWAVAAHLIVLRRGGAFTLHDERALLREHARGFARADADELEAARARLLSDLTPLREKEGIVDALISRVRELEVARGAAPLAASVRAADERLELLEEALLALRFENHDLRRACTELEAAAAPCGGTAAGILRYPRLTDDASQRCRSASK